MPDHMRPTSTDGRLAANALLQTNYDENGTASVYLPLDAARAMLTARGWKPGARGGWDAPDGTRYWEVEEALTVALLAEILPAA